jgi:hypothetical protein
MLGALIWCGYDCCCCELLELNLKDIFRKFKYLLLWFPWIQKNMRERSQKK